MVQDVYIKLRENMDTDKFYQKIKNSYENNDKVRFIFDTTGSSVNVSDMNKVKQVFEKLEELTKIKLEETCVIVDGDIKRTIISTFIQSIKQKKPVRIL
jgi:hypothetical protein|tara:strand:- start:168 stop:464 length:297 start_codon:yes stop_codon:yes gene_type:complete